MVCCDNGLLFQWAYWALIPAFIIWAYYLWREGPSYKKTNRIDGKVVIVTGCNTGIGREIALEMARRGARVYMACRNYQKCEEARQDIIQHSGNTKVFNRTLDLSCLKSVRAFVENFQKEETHLDILVNNAGIMATPRHLTTDGYEQQLAVNHLGHFLLTNLLLENLKSAAPSRIVVLSSLAYIFGSIQQKDLNSHQSYNSVKAYGQSKLANILFTRKLSQLLKGTGVTVNCLHPGSVQSELVRYNSVLSFLYKIFGKLLLRSTKAGAQTALYLALDPELEECSGDYYDCMRRKWLLPKARDDAMADWLWQQSEIMVGLKTDKT